MPVDVSRSFLALGLLIGAFMVAVYVVLSTSFLQWPGIDGVVWPTALALLVVSGIATPVPFTPIGKRAIAASPHKRSFAVGYLFVVLYTGIGIVTLLLLPFRMASGI